MDIKQLYDEWMLGDEPGIRPRRMQALRDDFRAAIGLEIPRRVSEIEALLDERSADIQRRLAQAARAEVGETGSSTDN